MQILKTTRVSNNNLDFMVICHAENISDQPDLNQRNCKFCYTSASFISSKTQFSFCTTSSLPSLVVTSLPSKHSSTKLADNAKSRRRASYMYRVTTYRSKNTTRKNCCSYHSSSKRSLSPFWFQLLTIVSSFIGTDFCHRELAVFRNAKIKITIVTLITSKSCDSQTRSTFLCSNSYPFYTYTPDIPICHCVYGVHESLMSTLNVLIISFVFL